jgi:hypothetical protein
MNNTQLNPFACGHHSAVKLIIASALSLAVLVSEISHGQESEWELERDRQGIQVFTRSVDL